jgi:hypothetical protein
VASTRRKAGSEPQVSHEVDATIRSRTVNLSSRVSHIQVAGKMPQGSLLPNAADFRPDVKSLVLEALCSAAVI